MRPIGLAVERSGGDLQQDPTRGQPVLADEEQVVADEGDHGHGAGMLDDVAHVAAAIGIFDGVDAEGHVVAAVDDPRLDDGLVQAFFGHRRSIPAARSRRPLGARADAPLRRRRSHVRPGPPSHFVRRSGFR